MKIVLDIAVETADAQTVKDKDGNPVIDANGRVRQVQVNRRVIQPGEEVESADLGLTDDQAKAMIESGQAHLPGEQPKAATAPPVEEQSADETQVQPRHRRRE